MTQKDLFGGRTGPAQDDEADYPYRFMSAELQRLVREDAYRREMIERWREQQMDPE